MGADIKPWMSIIGYLSNFGFETVRICCKMVPYRNGFQTLWSERDIQQQRRNLILSFGQFSAVPLRSSEAPTYIEEAKRLPVRNVQFEGTETTKAKKTSFSIESILSKEENADAQQANKPATQDSVFTLHGQEMAAKFGSVHGDMSNESRASSRVSSDASTSMNPNEKPLEDDIIPNNATFSNFHRQQAVPQIAYPKFRDSTEITPTHVMPPQQFFPQQFDGRLGPASSCQFLYPTEIYRPIPRPSIGFNPPWSISTPYFNVGTVQPTYSEQSFYHPANQRKFSKADGKGKRLRTVFTSEQLECLEKEFQKEHYIVGVDRCNLSQKLKLGEPQVKVWFQNRRIKWRKQQAERTGKIDASNTESSSSDADEHVNIVT